MTLAINIPKELVRLNAESGYHYSDCYVFWESAEKMPAAMDRWLERMWTLKAIKVIRQVEPWRR